MSQEERNIVILGAGFAGQSAAHYLMKHVYPTLKKSSESSASYKLILIDQSSHFWWHIAAPRAMVSVKALPHEKTFVPIMKGFEQYKAHKNAIVFKQAEPVAMDPSNRTVTIKSVVSSEKTSTANGTASSNSQSNGGATNPAHTETIPYHALVIATGTSTPTPLTSIHGDHARSMRALDRMNKRIATARTIVVAGGGPIGVETAGEIGEALNGPAPFGKPRPAKQHARITVISAGDRLLPVLRPGLAAKAEKFLNRVGVDVLYGTRVSKIEMPEHEDGATKVHLVDAKGAPRDPIDADVYIPATGVTPNTHFVPKALLDQRGYVKTNEKTLRVDDAGPRVYALGDVGSYTRGGVPDLFAAAPAMGAVLSRDLGVVPGVGEQKAGAEGKAKAPKDFKSDTTESQIVPVGRKKGVGAWKGHLMPSFAISMIKGRDYMVGNMKDITWGQKYNKAT